MILCVHFYKRVFDRGGSLFEQSNFWRWDNLQICVKRQSHVTELMDENEHHDEDDQREQYQ